MSKRRLVLQSFIDIPLWDRARWRGVAWLWPPGHPPGMGFYFENAEAGTQIFAEWKRRLGNVDEHEQLRVSVIEGPIPGADPGYNVRIGTNVAKVMELAGERATGNKVVLTASRIHRMNPEQGSGNLANFRCAFAEHKRYAIVQVVPDRGPMGIIPVFETALMKSEIFFRQVEEIANDDIDADGVVAPPR